MATNFQDLKLDWADADFEAAMILECEGIE